MAIEISVDLINQLKVSLRKEAKLSSVGDYSDSSSSSLPTSEEAIAELDASAPYLRCRNCKGKLLRGIESLICVFCGNQQRTSDNPPDPIKFTSTSAYKWFLSSLNLHGSEMVEPLKETDGSSRGATKAPVLKGIALSKFLDLEIQWSASEDKSINSGPDDGQSLRNKNPLNLGGINLDDFFVEGRGDVSKVEPAESKPVEDDDFKDPRSLSLFDSVKSQGVVGSQQHDNVGIFKGKDAQKNVSSEVHENLSLFAGRDAQESVSVAEQGNFGFFEEKDARNSFKENENLSLFEGKVAQKTSSSKEDESFGFFEDKDTQRNSFSKEDENPGLFNGKDAQRTSSSKDDESFGMFEGKEDAQRISSSKEDENFGLFEGAPSSTADLKSFDDKIIAASSDWDSDFQSADHNPSQKKVGGDPFVSSPVDLAAHMDSVFGSGKDLLYAKPADSSTAYASQPGDWLQDDLFGNVTGEAQNSDAAVHDKNEGQVVGGNGSSSMDIDWIGDDLWQTNEKKSIEKTPTDVNDDDDDWNDFASSANSKTPNNPLSQTMESSQDEFFYGQAQVKNGVKEQSVDEKQNTGTSVMSDIGTGQEDDIFGTWDSFTSSTIPQTSGEKNPKMNLFGENNNHRDLNFDSISRSDFFSESSGDKTNTEEVKVIPSGTSTLDRTSDPDGSKDQTVDLVVGTTTTAPKSKSDVAEELMSQMHDLSFMLETKLYVPPISKTE
ncbi:hypothetical protein ISN44_As01g004270 [Arabidopsis suecica]|uniref:DUF7815 domain-containing protein n=1 Tax=Arabidopsis suecica TaxID=45249 RepID=A0A8T2GZB5_ARASU|nr:hypothetical protein ISN44_As01g004270 [Arabidopsis suecica]